MLFDYVIRYLLYYVRLLFNIELDVYIRKKIYPRCIVVTNVRDVEKIIISRWNTVSFFILFFFFPLKYLVSRFFFFFLYDICFMASKTTLGVRSIKKKKKKHNKSFDAFDLYLPVYYICRSRTRKNENKIYRII